MNLIIMNAKTCEKRNECADTMIKINYDIKNKLHTYEKTTQHSQITHTQTTTS